MKSPAGSTLDFNPLDPAFHRDPYPWYHRLRSHDPVHRTWSFRPEWFLTRYDDVRFAITERSAFGIEKLHDHVAAKSRLLQKRDPSRNLDALSGNTSSWLLFIDPPDHTRMRKLVSQAFTPRVVEDLRPAIQEIVDSLIAAFSDSEETDLIAGLAGPLPVIVIARMLGLPEGDHVQLKDWAETMFRVVDQLHTLEAFEEMESVARKFAAYFREILAQRQGQPPRTDLIGALQSAQDEGEQLTENEIISFCMLLFSAGEETTLNLIGNGVHAILSHPDQRNRLLDRLDDPGFIESTVEELLRFDSPVQMISRVAAADIQLGGKELRRGDRVVACLAAANRDPERFANPDRLDLARPNNRHLAFGAGIHHCVGAPLARAEGQIAIRSLFRTFPEMALLPNEISFRPNHALRGLSRLGVRLGPMP